MLHYNSLTIISRYFYTNLLLFPLTLYRTKMNKCFAARARDSTMKLIYGRTFQFLIDTMNGNSLQSSNCNNTIRINLLDIPGYGEYHTILLHIVTYALVFHGYFSECFDIGKNCFEQICINFVNEKMRQFCTKTLITDEINWY